MSGSFDHNLTTKGMKRLDILYREDNEHPVLLVQPAVFHRQAHAVKQDAVQRFGIGGQILKPLLLKKSLWNAVERKQLSGLSVKVVKGHTILSWMKKQRWFIDMVDKSSL